VIEAAAASKAIEAASITRVPTVFSESNVDED